MGLCHSDFRPRQGIYKDICVCSQCFYSQVLFHRKRDQLLPFKRTKPQKKKWEGFSGTGGVKNADGERPQTRKSNRSRVGQDAEMPDKDVSIESKSNIQENVKKCKCSHSTPWLSCEWYVGTVYSSRKSGGPGGFPRTAKLCKQTNHTQKSRIVKIVHAVTLRTKKELNVLEPVASEERRLELGNNTVVCCFHLYPLQNSFKFPTLHKYSLDWEKPNVINLKYYLVTLIFQLSQGK